jgi:putative Ca2+/H+ antiporter (TMEM165/GDT1 family)
LEQWIAVGLIVLIALGAYGLLLFAEPDIRDMREKARRERALEVARIAELREQKSARAERQKPEPPDPTQLQTAVSPSLVFGAAVSSLKRAGTSALSQAKGWALAQEAENKARSVADGRAHPKEIMFCTQAAMHWQATWTLRSQVPAEFHSIAEQAGERFITLVHAEMPEFANSNPQTLWLLWFAAILLAETHDRAQIASLITALEQRVAASPRPRP